MDRGVYECPGVMYEDLRPASWYTQVFPILQLMHDQTGFYATPILNGHTLLETLGSQDQLMNLLQESMKGVCEARKSLHSLGNTATPEQVAEVLQTATQQPI